MSDRRTGRDRLSRRELIGRAGSGALALGLSAAGANPACGLGPGETAPVITKPRPQLVAWQNAELTMFVHFGVNTFTNREWGDGKEDPNVFDPIDLDAQQWIDAAKAAGFKYMILTAKHHDGFCLWPSRYTDHSVKSSRWRGGKGDVVRDFSTACHAAGMKMGLYLSPWDRHEPTYGDSPAYNRHYTDQLTELLTEYGEVAEVWLDGANGEGPNGKKQVYDFDAFKATIRRHQPGAVIFAPIDMRPDIRWIGNEDGSAGDPCWSPFDPDEFLEIDRKEGWGAAEQSRYQHGYADGACWMPGETDVSIRPGWFWHRAEDTQVKPLDHLMDIYFKSVGRNSLLLLNVPPNDRGRFSDADVARLRELRAALDTAFANDLARHGTALADSGQRGHEGDRALDGHAHSWWSPSEDATSAVLTVDLKRPLQFNVAQTQEYIAEGQRVSAYRIEAETGQGWQPVAQGATIGHKKLDRFPVVTARRVRLTLLEWRAAPLLSAFGLYNVA